MKISIEKYSHACYGDPFTCRFKALKIQYRLLLVFVLMLLGVYYICTQEQIRYGGGYPYDARAYVEMARQVSLGSHSMLASKPFVYRVGLPYLVGWLSPKNILMGFKILNHGFSFLTLFILIVYLDSYRLSWVGVFIGAALWVINPHGPFRFTGFYPALTDPPAMFFIVCILYIQFVIKLEDCRKNIIICALITMGVLFRESVLIVAVAVALARYMRVGGWGGSGPERYVIMWQILTPILAGFSGVYFSHKIVDEIDGYTFFGHASEVLLRNINNIDILPVALMMVYGPVLIAFAFFGKEKIRLFLGERPEVVFYALMVLLLSGAGGYHADRFMYWGFPAIIPALMMSLDGVRIKISLFVILIVLQVLASRALWQIPNAEFDAISHPGSPRYFILAPYGDGANFGQMHAAYMGKQSRRLVGCEYIIFFMIFSPILRAKCKKNITDII